MIGHGMPVIVSPALPIVPSDAENIVRMVRHGLADVLAWLGEDVGPKPGDCTRVVGAGGALLMSQEMHDKLSQDYRQEWAIG